MICQPSTDSPPVLDIDSEENANRRCKGAVICTMQAHDVVYWTGRLQPLKSGSELDRV